MFRLKNLSRRQLLSMAGGSAAASALMPLIPRVEAAESDAGDLARYSYWFEFVMPIDESIPNANYQQGFGPLAFRNGYTALNDNKIKNKVLFLRNVTRTTGDGGDGPHPSGVAGITGWRGGGNGKYNAAATSVDQYLAGKFNGQTTFSDIRAGFANFGKDGAYDRSTSVIKGAAQPRYQNPLELYNDVFKPLAGGGGGNSGGGSSSDLLRQRKSVLDHMSSTINKLSKKVSHMDKARVEQHLTSVRQTETQLERLMSSSNNNGSCDVDPTTIEAGTPAKVWPVYSELMTQAFACNLTRVAGAHYGGSASRVEYAPGKKWHKSTHANGTGAYLRDVLKFRAEQVANYLSLMEDRVEPNGKTLLDNTFFFWTTDVARKHENKKDMHCILAGATGSLKQHGNMVNAQGVNHNDILTSITHYMGEPVAKYGQQGHGNGPLPNNLFS